MPSHRPIAAVSAAAAAAALVLAGCSSSSGDDDTLSVWLPPFAAEDAGVSDLELWNEIITPFEEEHDVDVDVTIVPWENFEERFLTGFSSGDGPDIGYMYAEMIGDYISRGQLATFTVSDEQRETFYFTDMGQYGDGQYGLPMVVGGARVLFYNKAILDEVGVEPPQTWEDLVSVSSAVQAAGYDPLLMAWGEPGVGVLAQNYVNFLWQAGGDLIDEDGTAATFNSPEGLEAAQFLYDLRFTNGILPESTTALNGADLNAQFAAGDAAFAFGADGEATTYEEAGIDVGAVVLENAERYTFVATDVLVMAESSPNKDLAEQLAWFLLSGPSMDQFGTITSYPPISTEQTTEAHPLFADLYSADADVLREYPVVPNSATLYTSLYENLQQMLLGSKTPEQALADAEVAANESLARNEQ
ncbi:extracellular solute-binding protein family 1 [Beutenbergia cavernae DSM 12333]|uniref:Extracellular solute-binding protein family 1 n=1 Tax=Beutenbergia cavernae (strain ATCC BAA-8 / DSM 12333 / CCUG 43141 / JCM 11478 / NBRC 16432 / NCIMB 13614 / HKI 0122) TaxID=471853 RepID=C5BZP2_BEUC1|nr:sugar ABC transporter substrate-binding protein [Beutenbergia cavernae]ACQ81222.1 extracellular solute-binding protein family 1 [Beutenbergia cavernae DSM 12333]